MLARLPVLNLLRWTSGADGVLTALPALRALHVSKDILGKLLKTQELSHLLHEGGIEFRDCFERQQLVDRLASQQHALPPHVQRQLQDLLSARSTGGDNSQQQQPQAEGQGTVRTQQPASSHAWDSTGPMTPLAAAEPAAAGKTAPLPDPVSDLYQDEQRTVQLYQRCRPSVVHIACTRNGPQGFGGLMLNPEQVPHSFGSGFIWNKEGYIVTNFHVIKDARTAQVTLSNGKKYKASLRGAEPDKDLAVLKVDAPEDQLVPVAVGVSSKLVVGQRVYAIGNPFGLDHSLTAGIVSGLGRQMQALTGRVIRDVVQTDASINPGNSGGPLLDSRGQLIGVNTAATSHPQTTAGFGFAIPADTVRRIVNQLVRHGRVVRPGLGVYTMPDLHSRQLLGGKGGVVIEAIMAGSGAAQAGLRGLSHNEYGNPVLGDVVIAVGGQSIDTVEELVSAVEQFAIGDQVPITIHRYAPRSSMGVSMTTVELSVPLLHEVKSS